MTSLQRAWFVGVILFAALGVAAAFAQQAATKPQPVSHDLEGRAACLMCHTPGAMEPVPDVPESHADRPEEVCLWCHAPDAAIQTKDPKPIPHELEGRSACLMCHTAGAMEPVPDVPAEHEGWTDQYCQLCHVPVTGG